MSELKSFDIVVAEEGYGEGIVKYRRAVYDRSEADKAIAEKDKEIAELKDKLQNVSELLKETREWLIESQKMHKRCADNASKQIRRLKRALYKACAEWALSTLAWLDCIDQGNPVKWGEMRRKCLEKVEEYK